MLPGHALAHRADEEDCRTLRSHRTLILNYFRARKRYSSGVVEVINNKAKPALRKSYGFRTFHVTETACTMHLANCRSLTSPNLF